jgi:hypothetical protein
LTLQLPEQVIAQAPKLVQVATLPSPTNPVQLPTESQYRLQASSQT